MQPSKFDKTTAYGHLKNDEAIVSTFELFKTNHIFIIQSQITNHNKMSNEEYYSSIWWWLDPICWRWIRFLCRPTCHILLKVWGIDGRLVESCVYVTPDNNKYYILHNTICTTQFLSEIAKLFSIYDKLRH